MDDKEYIIPKNLNECFSVIEEILNNSQEDKDWFEYSVEEEAVGGLHSSLGKWIRNEWGLWSKDSELYNTFKKMDIWHADDMYNIIMTSYHRKIHGKDLNLKEQVSSSIDCWRDYEKKNGPIEK